MPSVSIFAFGKRGYTFGAANLAASIRHYADVRVKLYTDGAFLDHLKPHLRLQFDKIIDLDEAVFTTDERLDPGKCKTRIYDLIEDDETLYIDADSIAVKDITPLLRQLQADGRFYITECIDGYLPWASEKKVRKKLNDDTAKVHPIQSSWAFIRKCPEADKFFARVKTIFDAEVWTREELDHKWGKSIPDELVYTTACAMEGVDPSWDNVMLFGNKISAQTIDEVKERFYFLTLYGNGGGRPHTRSIYLSMYDGIMHRLLRPAGHNHALKSNLVLADKYLG